MSVTFSAKTQDPSVKGMIERYLAAGNEVKVIPSTDARLKPYQYHLDWASLTPHASAASVYRAARTTKGRQPVAHENWPPMLSTVTEVGSCPSAPGSSRANRFGILSVGLTRVALRAKGLRLSDLTRYLQSGAVKLSIPDGSGVTIEDAPGLSEHQEDVI